MSRRNLKKTTSAQFDFLIREMSLHPDAARGKVFGRNRDQIINEWKEIVRKLNDMGPPERTVTEWKKVWSDLRKRLHKRVKSIKSSGEIKGLNLDNLEYITQPENKSQICEGNPAENKLYGDATFETFKIEKQFAPSENHLSEGNNGHLQEMHLSSPTHSLPRDKLFLYPNCVESRLEESNEVMPPNNSILHTSNTSKHFQYQMEQQTRLLENLSNLSQTMSSTMERQAVAMEKQAAALERQAIAVEQHSRLLSTLVEYCLGPAQKSGPDEGLLFPIMR